MLANQTSTEVSTRAQKIDYQELRIMSRLPHKWFRPKSPVRTSVFRLSVIIIAALCGFSARAQNVKNILVLHEGNANHPANVIASSVFHKVFDLAGQNEFFEEYMDEDRLGANDNSLETSLRKKYSGKKIDLVVSDGRPALMFLLSRGKNLWPGTPKVFYFLDFRELPVKLPSNMTGVASNINFGAILDLALQLRPNTRHLYYVGGTDPWEETWRAFAEHDFKRFEGRVDVTFLNDLPFSSLLDRLRQLPNDSVVIYAELLRDAEGHVYVPAQVCPLVASASNAPVFGAFDTYLGCGIVGGVILDIKDLAAQTSKLGLAVLERGSASGFQVETSQSKVVLDWGQLRRWEISETKVPPGAEILFRPPSLWQQYKFYILTVLTAIVFLLTVIAVLAFEVRGRKKSESAVKNLTGQLITAGEDERRRIARELHDDIAQRLSLVSNELSMMQSNAPINDIGPQSSQREPLEQLNEVIGDLHNLSHQLHSSKLQYLGLEVALNDICQQLAKQYHLEIQFSADTIPFSLSEEVALCFYRVTQEALTNSVKHSRSARIEVRLSINNGKLELKIRDFGVGFDSSTVTDGLGLAAMRERLRLVEGRLLVNSRQGGGTEVTAQIQLERSMGRTTAA
jgi:signal transduction histidine kinase